MGYTTEKHPGGTITNYWPDDSDTEMYLTSPNSLSDIIDAATNKWPGIPMSDINIESEHIHTHCLYYDLYDSGDYTYFTRLSIKE